MRRNRFQGGVGQNEGRERGCCCRGAAATPRVEGHGSAPSCKVRTMRAPAAKHGASPERPLLAGLRGGNLGKRKRPVRFGAGQEFGACPALQSAEYDYFMQRLRYVLTLVLAAAALALAAYAQDAPAGKVEGTVLNTATGAGVAGARVVLSGNQKTRYEATSDPAGQFQIGGVAAGTYRASAEKDGFASSPFELSSFLNSTWSVESGPDRVKVDLKLTPLNTVAGRIFGPDGKPLAGAEVSLDPNITADSAVTNAEGRFALTEIRPGSYILLAKPPAGTKAEEAKDGTRTAMVPTYYPSTAEVSLAQRIVLRGEGGPPYEIQMQTTEVHRVRGIVVNEAGNLCAGRS